MCFAVEGVSAHACRQEYSLSGGHIKHGIPRGQGHATLQHGKGLEGAVIRFK